MQAEVKECDAVKGIIGYRVPDNGNIEPALTRLRSYAAQYPGFVDAEFMINEGNRSIGVTISTWQTMENWSMWLRSQGTVKLLRQAGAAVATTPQITAYTTKSAAERGPKKTSALVRFPDTSRALVPVANE
jgi:antibiotic biosynthesis monooxygenase (ABM) superfamily enzyme